MATVVQVPQIQSVGGAIGEGLGMFAAKEIADQERKKQMEAVQKIEEAIKSAPDRTTALELFNKIPFKDMNQHKTALDWLNTVHPVADTTPTEVKSYDPVTGKEQTKYVPRNELLKQPPSIKPETSQFFIPVDEKKGIYTDVGMYPTTSRPAANAITKAELDQRNKAKDDIRAEQARKDNDLAQNIATTKQFQNTVISMLPAQVKKVAADGSFTVDFTENPTLGDAYIKTLTQQRELLGKHGGDFTVAAEAGLRANGAFEKPAPAPAPATPVKSGGVVDTVKKFFSSDKKPAAAPAKQAAPAQGQQPTRPADVPANAKYSNMDKSWWWQDKDGNWHTSKKGK